nr:MAG TPA: hypothetical protein [Caudoviricetes sp.]
MQSRNRRPPQHLPNICKIELENHRENHRGFKAG